MRKKLKVLLLSCILATGCAHGDAGFSAIKIKAMNLPPVPDSPKEGLMGVDMDNDGVRDDIEHYIARIAPDSKEKRAILRAITFTYTSAISATMTESSIDDDAVSVQMAKLVSCLLDQSEVDFLEERIMLTSLIFDTNERLNAWDKYNHSRNGTTQRSMPSHPENCRKWE